jgi:hypothetical protein
MNKYLEFTDYFRLDSKAIQKVKDDYTGAFRPPRVGEGSGGLVTGYGQEQNQQTVQQPTGRPSGANGLYVEMAASHSGVIINNRMYLPDKMRNGVSSFVKPHPKPVQTHHNDVADPIGRIVVAEYVDTSRAVEDMVALRKTSFSNSVSSKTAFRDLVEGRASTTTVVEILNAIVRDGLMDVEGYTGLGYAKIGLNITDKDAIEKFLDQRYLTGSVGARTDAAICSVCKQDWVEDGFCEHEPGKIYDGVLCFTITGNLKYSEYSIVNHPADIYSQVISITNSSGTTERDFTNSDNRRTIYQVPIYVMDFSHKKEENNMKVTDNEQAPEQQVTAPASSVEVEEVAVVLDEAIESPQVQNEVAPATQESAETVETEDSRPPATQECPQESLLPTEAVEKTELEQLLQGALDGSLDSEASAKLYDEMMGDSEVKLPIEQLKKLPKSAFCGPCRSLPVPDAVHYAAAKKLLGLYKGDSDSSKILASIERKGKMLGCKTTEPVVAKDFSPAEVVNVDKFERTQLEAIVVHINKHLGVHDNSECILELQADNEALMGEIENLEVTVGNLRDELESLEIQRDSLLTDSHQLQDHLIGERLKAKTVKTEYLQLLSSLSEKKTKNVADFESLSEDLLDAEIIKIRGIVDIEKISNKLNDGMTREPAAEEHVDSPVAVMSTMIEDEEKVKTTKSQMEEIQLMYQTLLFSKGAEVAAAYIRGLQREGVIPKTLKQ